MSFTCLPLSIGQQQSTLQTRLLLSWSCDWWSPVASGCLPVSQMSTLHQIAGSRKDHTGKFNCTQSLSTAVINQKSSGGRKSFFQFSGSSLKSGKPRQGLKARDYSNNHGEMLHTGLLLGSHSGTFYFTVQTKPLKDGTVHGCLDLPL